MKEGGYTLIELMLVIAISGIIMGSLCLINKTVLRTWGYNKKVASLQQELRLTMNSVVNTLNSALVVRVDDDKDEVVYLNQDGEEKEIAYQEGVGLYSDSIYNLISNRISQFNVDNRGDRLLVIDLTIKEKEEEFSLKSGVLLNNLVIE